MPELNGWPLLHSPLPPEALKPLDKSVYGVSGLTDVNEGYLIERLWQSGLRWRTEILQQTYLGSEERKSKSTGYVTTYYLAQVHLRLHIEIERGCGIFDFWDGSGGDDNKKLDAAFKGAKTVAFKSACKEAGLTTELYKGGKAMDLFQGNEQGEVSADPPATESATATTGAPPADVPGKFTLTALQKQHLAGLVAELPEEQRAEAREAAFQFMQTAAKSDPTRAFSAGAEHLFKLHRDTCGGECTHIKVAQAANVWGSQAA